jgi:glycosyltransferase involved in cell wall biosynthesis
MTIGVDIRVLARGTRTGVEEYTLRLLSHLLPLDKNIHYKLFYNAFSKVDLDYDWLHLDNVSLYDFRIPNRAFFFTTRYLNQPKIDRLLNGIDLYFNPHFFTAPVSVPKVITFHDLSFKRHPEFFSWKKRMWQFLLMNTLKEARQAKKIIAVSESTKNDLVNLYRIDPEKIQVIYSGVGNFRPGSPGKTILYFGTIEPRKNLIGLIRAFRMIKKPGLKLVLAGSMGWLYKDILKEAAGDPDIVFTGFFKEEDKEKLYRSASLFVYPSFFEGFGFPPLEAMACGVPVIVSNTSSLPEIVGDAALMVDPYNIDEMAWLMNEGLNNVCLREELIKRGLARAQMFSWERCARETLKVLTK